MYKAKLEDGKLVELRIGGKKVPDNELHNYDSLVAEKAKEYDELLAEYHDKAKKYKEEMKELHKKIDKFGDNNQQNFNYNFPDNHSFSFPNFPFDSTKWEEMAENLQKGIREGFLKHPIVIPPIHIPQINIPPINIPEINFNWDCDSSFDKDAFKESMKEWNHNFKINMKNFNLNMDDFKADMKKMKADLMNNGLNNETFKTSMKNLSKNMGKLKNQLQELKSFNIELRDQLENDNLLKDGDSIDNLTISKDEMIVDGKKVSPELHEKYLTLYKKHFGKELKGSEKFEIE
jgi:inhibitor of KinA sporulation pathway (predicted exonuclease)